MKKPLNIALMFFNDHPEDFFPYAYIEIVTKPDPTGTDMEEMVFKGPLHIQLKNALRHIGNMVVNDLQDKAEGLDVSVLPTGSVSGLPVALHPYG